MRFFYIFLTISTVSAVPFPVNSNDRSIPYGPARRRGRPSRADELARPLQDPNVTFPKKGGVPPHDQDSSRAEVLKDFRIFSAQSPASARKTKLALVSKDWVYLHDRQCLEVRYCTGMRKKTSTVDGGDRTIYRNIPPENPLVLSFNRQIQGGEIRELTGHITKYYNALPRNSPYRRAELTRVERGWRPGGGNTDEIQVRDHLLFTSHKSTTHTDNNIIGEPHIIRRPLTVSFGNEVEEGLRDHIEKKVREHHNTMDFTDIAKPSNVALVEGGSYKNADGKDEVRVKYYKFPDHPRGTTRT